MSTPSQRGSFPLRSRFSTRWYSLCRGESILSAVLKDEDDRLSLPETRIVLSIFLPIRVQQEQVKPDHQRYFHPLIKYSHPLINAGAGRNNPLLNGPAKGRLHPKGGPCHWTSLFHLVQPLHVQRRVHPRRSHGCWLPSLPGSSFNLNKNPLMLS